MPQLKNPMEIFKLLPRTNCRECREATCLAFAASVFQGKKSLDECPHLSSDIINQFGSKTNIPDIAEQDLDETLSQLKKKISTIDLSSAAQRLGAKFSNNKLTIKVLGKDFSVDSKGRLSSDIHLHEWIAIPFLNHILFGAGVPASGKWVPLRELKNGKTWYRLFGQRCEKPLKRVADIYTDLFKDMIHIFNGKEVENHYTADISLVLHPLPKVPMLICYWEPDEGLESSLNLFFDSTAEENLKIESLYTLGAGLVRMFEKIAQRHGLQ
jgi:hypothetical protein